MKRYLAGGYRGDFLRRKFFVCFTVLFCFSLINSKTFSATTEYIINDKFYRFITAAAPEYKIKGVFLFNFVSYIKWPTEKLADSKAPINICIFGDEKVAETLDYISKKKTRLKVIRVANTTELDQCHIAFLSKTKEADLDAFVEATKEKPILSVSDSDKFIDKGGIVFLTTVKGKLQIAIGKKALDSSQLKASSKLLGLAKIK